MRPFQLERYFARYEFNVNHLLCASDCESLSLAELLAQAPPALLRRWETLRLGYTESQGDPDLRAAIAAGYATAGADDVLVAAPEELIFLLMHCLLRPGDEVVAIAPAYQSLHEVAEGIGATVRRWPVRAVDGAWRLDLDELAALLSDRTRLLVVNFPHNPTGYLPSAAEFAAIVALADRHGVTVFCDEMYRGLEYDAADSLPSICDVYTRGIALSGLSKVHALPGLRIGWLALHDPTLLAAMQAMKDYTTICNSAPSEVLALMALDRQEQIITRNLAIIEGNRDAAAALCAQYPALLSWLAPSAGSVAFPQWRGPLSVDALCEQLVSEEGVLLAPGSLFAADGSHFRFGLGRHGFGAGLARMEHWLDRTFA